VALISAGGLWLIHGSYVHVRSGGWEGPQYLKWRTAPTFVQPALGLLGGAVCAAAWALVCIARWRSRGVLRRGAPLSLASLVIGAMWLMFIDEVYLAPRHAKPRPTWVDMKLPLAATSKSPSPFPWNADIQMQAWSNEGVTQIAFHSATHWTNRWELPRLQPDGWQGSVDDPGWRDWLDDAVGRMPQEGDSNGERFPDSAVLLRFEAGLRFGDIAPLLERAQSLGVWKYFVATSGAEMPGALFGFFVYTTRHGTDDLQGVRHRTGTITVRSVEGSLEYSCGDLRARELPAFFAALVEAEGRDFTALLDVEEDVKWSDVVRVVEACSPGLDGFAR
jgi:hypothetical protein